MAEEQSRYERFLTAYQGEERPRWDTGIVPPEVRALVESAEALAPGRAVDVGCGTGVSTVFLAVNGWQVTGVDWIESAVVQARQRAAQTGLADGQAAFVRADVEAADFLADHEPVSLWLDIGCLHGMTAEAQAMYAAHARRLVAPGGVLRLYSWQRHEKDGRMVGLDPDEVEALFASGFKLEDVVLSQEDAEQPRPAGWYLLKRLPD